jgi:hypothetical protein
LGRSPRGRPKLLLSAVAFRKAVTAPLRLAGRENVRCSEPAVFKHVEPSGGNGALALFLDGSKLYFRLT